MNNPTAFLVVAVLGLVAFAVLLIGGVLLWRDESKNKAKRRNAAEAQAAGTTAPAAKAAAKDAPAKGGAHEVLRVLRDDLSGRLVVEVAGQRYASGADIKDPQVQAGLRAALVDLQAFAGVTPAPLEGPTVGSGASPAASARPAGTAPLGTSQAGSGAPLPPPSMNPFKQVQVLREIAKHQAPPPKSITEQVDEILQGKLAGTPYLQRGISVRAGPKGSALFLADGQEYQSVDDVPDAAVRELIRAAVAEWEAGVGS